MDIDTAGLAAQQAIYMQTMGLSMMKHAADTERQLADMIAETVTPSNRGKTVDFRA